MTAANERVSPAVSAANNDVRGTAPIACTPLMDILRSDKTRRAAQWPPKNGVRSERVVFGRLSLCELIEMPAARPCGQCGQSGQWTPVARCHSPRGREGSVASWGHQACYGLWKTGMGAENDLSLDK